MDTKLDKMEVGVLRDLLASALDSKEFPTDVVTGITQFSILRKIHESLDGVDQVTLHWSAV